MADNLTAIFQTIDDTINNTGGESSILASEHRAILQNLLESVGKYTGAPFKARQNPVNGIVPSGVLFFNGNALNNTNDFVVTTSKNSADLNDIGLILEKMTSGSLIHFKDFSGRSVYFVFKSFVADQDSANSDIYNITVSGLAENTNYSYQPTDNEISVIEFILTPATSSQETIVVDGVTYRYKQNTQTGTVTQPVQYDIAENGIREITDNGETFNVVEKLIYNAGPAGDIASWEVVSQSEISF